MVPSSLRPLAGRADAVLHRPKGWGEWLARGGGGGAKDAAASEPSGHVLTGDADALATRVAELLDDQNVVGWFQGRMEFGPRALGGRSIIGDPRNTKMQSMMNVKIKYRESFRPFAPIVLARSAKGCQNMSQFLGSIN